MVAAKNYVLVADSEPELGRQVRAELAGLDLEVLALRDGLSAHDALTQRGVPLVLVTDLNLPRRDGFALLRGLRRLDRARKVPAVAVTRFPQMLEVAAQARAELGPLSVHRKPLSSGVVGRVVREALKASASAPAANAPAASAPAASAPAASPPEVSAPVESRGPFSQFPPKKTSLPPESLEQRRLAKIAEMQVHDHEAPPDPELQALVRKVANDFGVPMVLATLVLEDRQWFKAYTGISGEMLAERGTLREWSFCQHVVEGAAPLIVPDARTHPLFADNPLVKSGAVTGYAGAPLTTPTGEVLGSLCLIDQRALDIDLAGVARLSKAARAVAGELEVRALRRRGPPTVSMDADAALKAMPYVEATLAALEQAVVLLGPQRRAILTTPALKTIFGVDHQTLRGRSRDEIVDLLASSFLDPRADRERLQVSTTGPWVLREQIELATGRVVRWVGRPVALPDGIGQLITITDITPDAA